jgi:amino acid transporter
LKPSLSLITVLAAINVGTFRFFAGSFWPEAAGDLRLQLVAMVLITGSQAVFNHLGIRVTAWLTDFSGYWILLVAAVLTVALLASAPDLDLARLITFNNFSGLPPATETTKPVYEATDSIVWLFVLGFLLPAYTITGFDASAHTAEETMAAAHNVPRGILRSVLVSGIAGWIMLAAVVLAAPNLPEAAAQGDQVFFWTIRAVLPPWLVLGLCAAIVLSQYLCGLATVTSASRMAFAFARDGGLPCSAVVRRVSPRFRTPAVAVWVVAAATVLFTLYTPVYETITAVCTILLYLSYVLPTALGFVAFGRSWRRLGPWHLGCWYRPAAAASAVGCGGLIFIGMQPPNEKSFYVVAAMVGVLSAWRWLRERRRFPGPPLPQSMMAE